MAGTASSLWLLLFCLGAKGKQRKEPHPVSQGSDCLGSAASPTPLSARLPWMSGGRGQAARG